MIFRTDPLTDDGKFDVDFFASSEYVAEQKSLIRYLTTEGFTEINEEFVLDYRSRRWQISTQQQKRKL